jgi:hypothetical protein
MNTVLSEIVNLLKKQPYTEKFYNRLWKALFYGKDVNNIGLWNYDKLMNQHYLCE